MKVALLLILTICCLVLLVESKRCKQYTDDEADQDFEKHYDKILKHAAQTYRHVKKKGREAIVKTKSQRKDLFKREKDRINKANKGNRGFCQVLNEFSALSDEEFEAGFLGAIPQLQKRVEAPTEEGRGKQNRTNDGEERLVEEDDEPGFKQQVPESVDHRASTGEVENQGGCNTCWSFTGIHVLTGVLNLKAGVEPMQYSKQQLADCMEGRNYSCEPWWTTSVWEHLYSNRMELEIDYPYLGTDNTCSHSTPEAVETRVLSWDYTGDSESEMMAVLAEHPIAVSMNVSIGGFKSYGPFEDGTYGVWSTEEPCESSGHAMTAVGFGTDADWGTGFGDQGYIKVKRGVNVCSVESSATYPIVSSNCLAQRWQFTSKTGEDDYAGTDNGYIYIVLHGAEGHSDRIFPYNYDDNFDQPGQVDVIAMNSVRVGRLKSIDVGTTSHNGWYVEWIELKDLTNGDVYRFVLNKWLDLDDVSEYSLNVVAAMQDWQLVTKTGEGTNADTSDEAISYTIKGTERTATTVYAANSEQNYAIGKTDTFTFKTHNVGTVTGMIVTTKSSNGWYMEWATLTEVATGNIYNFVLNNWVDWDDQIAYDLTPVEAFQNWTLETQTNIDPDAGTFNEVIYVKITGSLRATANIYPDNLDDNFEVGQLDVFSLTTELLGTVTQIQLGTTSGNGWLPDWVKLIDNDSGTEYMFTVGEWIDLPGTPRITLTPD